MRRNEFFYELPQALIAQKPLEPRDSARLLVLHKESGALEHRQFRDILDILKPNDCLILNDSRVIPARIYGKRQSGGEIEFLLLKELRQNVWEIMCRPGKKAKAGSRFSFGAHDELDAEILEIAEDGNRICKFTCKNNAPFFSVLEKVGKMPLPHYIKEKLEDKERYQTVYARENGSAAAPTAGLHFTAALLDEIKKKGVQVGFVTLHVGLGTFRPVKAEKIEDHQMHAEHYHVPEETVKMIHRCKGAGGRVFCVGTTSCRTLESVYKAYGELRPCEGWTDIFIYPGYQIRSFDALITNFHLPESTLIMLVSAFAGFENTKKAYASAIENSYRFFSFGDAMLIL